MTPKMMIKKALKNLGIEGKPKIKPVSYHRYQVKVGKSFEGIYDIDRKTFVD